MTNFIPFYFVSFNLFYYSCSISLFYQIQVDKPDIRGRKQIFDVYLRGITLDGEVEIYSGRLAALTPGFSGADISNICNEAAILAARRNKTKVDISNSIVDTPYHISYCMPRPITPTTD